MLTRSDLDKVLGMYDAKLLQLGGGHVVVTHR